MFCLNSPTYGFCCPHFRQGNRRRKLITGLRQSSPSALKSGFEPRPAWLAASPQTTVPSPALLDLRIAIQAFMLCIDTVTKQKGRQMPRITSRTILKLFSPCIVTPGRRCGYFITPALKKRGCGFYQLTYVAVSKAASQTWHLSDSPGAQDAPITSLGGSRGCISGGERSPVGPNVSKVWEPRE